MEYVTLWHCFTVTLHYCLTVAQCLWADNSLLSDNTPKIPLSRERLGFHTSVCEQTTVWDLILEIWAHPLWKYWPANFGNMGSPIFPIWAVVCGSVWFWWNHIGNLCEPILEKLAGPYWKNREHTITSKLYRYNWQCKRVKGQLFSRFLL